MSRIARERAAEQQAGHRARGVVRHLDHRRERADAEPAAAGGDQRMHIDHGLAAVQFLQHRLVHRIAEPLVAVVALQVDAVGLERDRRRIRSPSASRRHSSSTAARNTPKRPGWSWRILAAKSWHSRTVLAAPPAPASNQRPGVEASDITAVRTPSLSINSISLAGLQFDHRHERREFCACPPIRAAGEVWRRIDVASGCRSASWLAARARAGAGSIAAAAAAPTPAKKLAAGRVLMNRKPGNCGTA